MSHRRLAVLAALLLVAACASGPPDHPAPPPHHPGGPPSPAAGAPAEPTGEIALADVLAAALLGSPELAGASFAVRSAEARLLSAGRLPNPELSLEAEEFGGQGGYGGFDAAELGVGLSQEILLAGQLGHHEDEARAGLDRAAHEHEAARLCALARAARAFYEVLAAQERLRVLEATARLGDEVARSVGERIAAGQTPRVEESRALLERELVRLGEERARRDLDVKRHALAATWGGDRAAFSSVTGDLGAVRPAPPLARVEAFLPGSPGLRALAAEVEAAKARLALEKARRIPDLTLQASVRHARESGEAFFTVGVSVPLPIFDRNEGAVLEAAAELDRARAEARAAEVGLRQELLVAHDALAGAAREVAALAERVVPAARLLLTAARDSFELGKTGSLEVLDAWRTLLEAEESLVTARAAWHAARADVERITGRDLVSMERSD
ncbi:MAG: TolC family protein [Planctomycetes bacterium]|jgi:cobalt-zinc-cadmium efflux system outer membrane protein|nr:TolC family protein [Planctomycetota bacterium]